VSFQIRRAHGLAAAPPPRKGRGVKGQPEFEKSERRHMPAVSMIAIGISAIIANEVSTRVEAASVS
jgi:hypothetical protein